jgi:Cu(I)/Ag(I) efflux system membrane fusion protein
MNTSKQTLWIAGFVSIVIIFGGVYFFKSELKSKAQSTTIKNDMPRYQIGELEIGVMTDPTTPMVGENHLIIELREPDGAPVSGVAINAYAEMPAMGAMPAMRRPAGLQKTTPGRYEGKIAIPMRGEWPLTIEIKDSRRGDQRLKFDLATDREGLTLAAGAKSIGRTAVKTEGSSNVITIDSRRWQMIGVKTSKVTNQNLVKNIRAVGEVKFDERLFSNITLKFDGYIGDLKANYVGATVKKGQVLFTVYSPELLAAQQEYLQTLEHRKNRKSEDTLLRASRQRLALWDMSDREIQALEQRGTPKDYISIYAPRTGTLIERNIADGSAARMGQTLLTIADLSRVWIEAEVFEADLELIHVGMTAAVTLPYLPKHGSYPATVEYVYPYLKSDSRTGRIRMTLDNLTGDLKPDMYTEVSLEVDLGNRLSVPEEAIIVAGKSRVVFIALGEGRLKPVWIKTGRRVQGFVEVLEGLSPGDTVVTSGNFLIAAETRLKTGIKQW